MVKAMNDREYLIKLLGGVEFQYTQMHSLMTENVADHLLQHGVTVQRHGRWIVHHRMGNNWCECSECNTVGSPQWKRCPVCEAKMDGE
jgi:hypothetical protein